MNDSSTILSILTPLGLRPFLDAELSAIHRKLSNAISIGTQRASEPTTLDGGVLGVRTSTHQISPKDFDKIPVGSSVISCAYAGTNWITTLVSKTKEGELKTDTEKLTEIQESERSCTYNELCKRMADEIIQLAEETDISNTTILAISFGFPHSNVSTSYGIDAQITSRGLTKHWEIIDLESYESFEPLGKTILSLLKNHDKTKHLSYIYILNDTNAVSHFRTSSTENQLPVGFVFGTGVNASLGEYNLEIGKVLLPEDIANSDKIHSETENLRLLPSNDDRDVIENWIGGDFLKDKVAGALSLLEKKQQIPQGLGMWFAETKNHSLVSDYAQGGICTVANHIQVSEREASVLCEIITNISSITLIRASQLIATIIASVIQHHTKTPSQFSIPIEGSVFWKGYKVKEITQDTLGMLLPNTTVNPIEASGILGIATYALAKHSPKS
ncbi:hypothetical protein KC717_03005 [Candidatus Dojkabacteria bacterium]|uniref:Hexokinase C-terminal domain-containing protein n=1 Tax=Candidatus Dojkabacteria bacterium TaxID=2099670 RepID=A0A955L7R2_9BACT|nr:hypothetical protein [Candidatus Dojkabacteria bacterium]